MADDEPAAPVTVASGSAAADLDRRARAILDAHWRRTEVGGYCVPHASTYPWQWLWDSCFHAVVWAHLGDERAVLELESVFDAQDASGFVPHVNYRGDHRYDGFWGRRGTSCLTQPPVYGHAAAVLVAHGLDPGDRVLERARAALRHLLVDRPRHRSGLVALLHPWESGADDSPRWDAWCDGGWSIARWYDAKGSIVESLERDEHGAGRRNAAFDVAAAGFNALVAHDARCLAELTGDAPLRRDGDEVAELLADRWDAVLLTWRDAGAPGASTDAPAPSGAVRTLDALLGALVAPPAQAHAALATAVDDEAFGGAAGPAGVHRDEPTYSPGTYWRGAAWPQLTYLLWTAAGRIGDRPRREALADRLVRGAVRSGFAEHWHPDTSAPGGAVPQSWATLAAAVARVAT